MTRNRHNRDFLTKHIDAFTTTQGTRAACDRLVARRINLGLPARFQFGDAPLMIGVVMGNQDAFQHQPASLQPCLHRRSITGVDDEGTLAPGQQPDVIILERGNERNF